MAGIARRTSGQQVKLRICMPPRPAGGERRADAGRTPPPLAGLPDLPALLMTDSDLQSDDTSIHEDGLWRDNGWTARIIKNEDDDGWAVEMVKDGESEPALVGPWTMGRDKKNPKPMDANAFRTLVKTATEVLMRHEQQRRAMLHKEVTVQDEAGQDVSVTLDIVPDEFEPYAQLKAFDPYGELLAEAKVSAGFKLNKASAERWAASGFDRPA